MSYIHPNMQAKFNTLSADLQNEILKKEVKINTLKDLIRVLEEISNKN